MTSNEKFKFFKGSSGLRMARQDDHSTVQTCHHGHSHGVAGELDHHEGDYSHGHTHDVMDGPGTFSQRDLTNYRTDWSTRAFTVGIGGPVGSGKTALVLALCKELRDEMSVCVVTNDIFTKEDYEFLLRQNALNVGRLRAVETGGCPHAAIREDFSTNLFEVLDLTREYHAKLVFIESGGDNLAATFSRKLADYIIYVIDVAGGDKIPRKGGPGVTESDLLVINKTDLADAVGASLEVMASDARRMRKNGPVTMTQAKHGVGVNDVARHIVEAMRGHQYLL